MDLVSATTPQINGRTSALSQQNTTAFLRELGKSSGSRRCLTVALQCAVTLLGKSHRRRIELTHKYKSGLSVGFKRGHSVIQYVV